MVGQSLIVLLSALLFSILQVTCEIIADIKLILVGLALGLLEDLTILGFLDICNFLGLPL